MARKRAPVGVRREEIVRAAFEVASREGIGGLTIRAVAAEAGVSHALVVHYFQRKERLVHALLDWLIETTTVLHISDDVARFPRALDRLHALLQQEMERLSHQPRHTRLFLRVLGAGRAARGDPGAHRRGVEALPGCLSRRHGRAARGRAGPARARDR